MNASSKEITFKWGEENAGVVGNVYIEGKKSCDKKLLSEESVYLDLENVYEKQIRKIKK